MKYKYQRRQIFGKRLKVPKHILNKVYNCTLSFNELIEYQLDDKIPTSCLAEADRKIVERFGIEKCKDLDWELINKRIYGNNINFRDILMSIDSQTEDINKALYELVKDQIKPRDYSTKMSKIYSDRLFEIPQTEVNETYDYSKIRLLRLKEDFNNGKVSLKEIIRNWELFKDKDLSYCLLKDENNKNNITDSSLKEFMNNYGTLMPLIVENNDIYSFINSISSLSSEEEKHNYLKQFTDDILSNTYSKHGDDGTPIILTDEEYKEIFKYSSIEDYLKIINEWRVKPIIDELKTLPDDYIFNMPIPFSELLDYDILTFIGIYGLKNVIDFDNECGHFFSKNNCEMLKLMNNMYLHYADNIHDPNKTIFTKKDYDENGNYVDRPYTKDEFYEAMRRMIIYGPSDGNYRDKAPDYRQITGEFRKRNQELFIDENAPEELQKMFYTKSITPQLLLEHSDYIQYLKGKDLSSCFKNREIQIEGSNALYGYENLYKFLGNKTDFDGVISFIIEYCDVLDIIYDRSLSNYYQYEIKFSNNDDIEQIQDRIQKSLNKILIEKGLAYPKHIPKELREKYPSMFLDYNAPQELQEAFYGRTINSEFILSNPSYINYLTDVDLELLFKYMPVRINSKDSSNNLWYDSRYHEINFIKALKKTFGESVALDVMLIYGKYVDQVYEDNKLNNFLYDPEFTKDEFLDELDKTILQNIIDGNMKYDESIPSHFKNNNPTLFLGADVPKETKDKFYNREFTLKDFNDNPELLNIFENTNIACAFSKNMSWIIPLFNDYENFKIGNYNRMKVISAYSKIEDNNLKLMFSDYVKKNINNLNIERIDDIAEVFSRLEYSNAIELSSFKMSIANLLLQTDDPIKRLDKIEDIFLRNNLPLCGKMFLCFNSLYPNLSEVQKFDFSDNSRVAPELRDDNLPDVGFHASNNEKRLIIIFNDLLRVSYRSNERSLLEYLDNIEKGNDLYLELQNNNISINDLNNKEREILELFISHLEALYDNTKKGKEEKLYLEKLPLEEKLDILTKSFKPNDRYDLKNRIVRSFCYTADIKSFDELKQLVTDSLREQKQRTDENLKELERNNRVFKFEEGDMVRCIGHLDSLGGSINTGNFSKEHLGVFLGSSESDTTPLDVDLTYVTQTDNIYNAIDGTPTGFGFGNIYIIIKKDNPNFYISRDKDGNLTGEEYDPKKVEMFGTSTANGGYQTHWGARTGISLADVDYILFKKRNSINSEQPYDENGNVNYLLPTKEEEKEYIDELSAVKFEIAKNGYYIPVIDFAGKLIFTKEEFNELRNKMQGLSHYNETTFELSDELINPEVKMIASSLTEKAKESTDNKRNQVNAIVKEVMDEMGLTIKYEMDDDLSRNSVEFIDTGSTGRETNIPFDGDFDFFMRLDADIMRKPASLKEFKDKLEEKFSKRSTEKIFYTNDGDLRIKRLKLENGEIIDVDISFGVKTNKVKYSSDQSLRDRLNTIKELYPDQYKYVVANIIMAKRFFKSIDVNAYKPRRTDPNQGGLGGVGIENWILQNGGSFTQACKSIIDVAIDLETGEMIPFDEFKKKYQIWDFGENHFSGRKNTYLYDNFVENNMNENGYKNMIQSIKKYLKSMEISKEDTETIIR